jgi:hypothetical protein
MKRVVNTALVAALATMVGTQAAQAQAGLTSSVQTVTINATKVPVLTVAINSGATQTIASLTDGTTNNFAAPVNVTTTWDVGASTASVALVGYFSTPASALVNGASAIPSSLIKGAVNAGAYNAFTGNAVGSVGTAGGSLTIFSQNTPTGASRRSNRTDNLALQVDLTGQTPLVPGTFTGTLNLQAVTQ